MSDPLITQQECAEIFGDIMPVEAAKLLQDGLPGGTVADVRLALYKIALKALRSRVELLESSVPVPFGQADIPAYLAGYNGTPCAALTGLSESQKRAWLQGVNDYEDHKPPVVASA